MLVCTPRPGDTSPDPVVRCVAGDLEKRHWGLADGEWARLCARLGAVVHVGAHVNHMLPYEALSASITLLG